MSFPRPVRKAVFPVAGMGTRFLPATKSIPKEMLPIVDKPLVQYAVEEALEAGIETLIFITSRHKHTISDHFSTAFELETKLTRAGKTDLLHQVTDIVPDRIGRVYVTQAEALGLQDELGTLAWCDDSTSAHLKAVLDTVDARWILFVEDRKSVV